MRSVLANRPDLKREHLERTRNLMNTHARESLVTGYEELIETLSLPDPNDRHVLAAAIHSGAEIIVTFNLSDFPGTTLAAHGIESQHPDGFINHLIDTTLDGVLAAAKLQRESLNRPPKDRRGVLEHIGSSRAISNGCAAASLPGPDLIAIACQRHRSPQSRLGGSERQLPGLSDEIMPEALQRFLPDETTTGRDVDSPRGAQHVVRPQDDLPASDLAGASSALLDEGACRCPSREPSARPARGGVSSRASSA